MSSCSYPFIQPNYGSNSGGGGSGTVTSVALSLPAIFSVSGSPVTTAGTLTATLATQTAGKILAAPPTTTGTPTFQQIVAEHLNSTYTNGQVLTTNGSGVLSWSTPAGAGTVTSVGLSLPTEITVTGTPVTTSGTLTGTWTNQTAGKIFAAPPTTTGTPTFQQIKAEHLNATYSNTQILTTDGTGVLSWVAKPTGTVTSVALSMPSEFQVANSPVTSSGTLTVTWGATVPAGRIFAAPPTSTGAPSFQQIVAEHLNATYSNGQVLTTNGSGVLSWTTISAGAPGSPTNSVQYNNAGAFAGSSNLTFDGTAFSYINTANNLGAWFQQQGSGLLSQGLLVNSNALINDFLFGAEHLTLSATNTKVAYFSRGTSNSTRSAVHVNDYPTSTPQPAFLVTASSSASSTAEVGQVLSVWNNKRIGVRLSGNPTNGIVEIPWITGDTLPTLYVGNTSSNVKCIQAVNNGGAATIDVTNSSSFGSGINVDANYAINVNCNYTNGIAITANATSPTAVGLYVADGGNARTIDLVQIYSSANNTSNALRIWNTSTNFLTTTATGLTSVRSGLSTDNKMTDVGGVYFTSTTDVGNVGTGEDNLSSVAVSANVLGGTDGDRIEIEGSFECAANANTKTIRLYFGASKIIEFDGSNSGSGGSVTIRATVIRTGATTQRCYATATGENAPSAATSNYITASETLSSAITVKFTGEATATDDIVENTFTIKFYPKGGA